MTRTGNQAGRPRRPPEDRRRWKEILGLLKHELETGDLTLPARVMFRVMWWLSFMLPRTTRTGDVDARGW